MLQQQKELVANAPLKEQRLYQRLLEKEKKIQFREQQKKTKGNTSRMSPYKRGQDYSLKFNEYKSPALGPFIESRLRNEGIYSPDNDD